MRTAGQAKKDRKQLQRDIAKDLRAKARGRHSRRTIAAYGVSLPTADRWLRALQKKIPGVRRVKVGKTAWYEWQQPSWAAP